MSLTLGEKLRQAREERGISISEVAEQTRISAHYLESIENDDYRPLPGGIFNKGFVKSYAKFIDIDEQEVLQDYARLIAANDNEATDEIKHYRPEVLTDDRNGSMIPTIIVAVVILGLMTVGVLYLVDYLRNQPDRPPSVAVNTNSNAPANTADGTVPEKPKSPEFSASKFEFAAVNQPVRVLVTSDDVKTDKSVASDAPLTFEPKESINFNYNRWNAQSVKLTINGKAIALPATPLSPADGGRIQFTISKDNFAKIWEAGSINGEIPEPAANGNTNTALANAVSTPAQVSRPTPVVKPTANVDTTATPANKPAATPKPAPTAKPAATAKPVTTAPANRPQ
ncbi:MAG TPA: helix-turn-helix domain-containing protein [Pyrinomonadaceae bacterium]|nr:helix-turn-helix domain-containing protein [Chloracidobacterium sp.]MBP9936080.1 helix-turn-helix domain-containing protein [Pyrinomonadaceae bacterium]MBK9439660.1 helix-turn-helix domain-containing protein [Chloracidobacterium sp.]MBL0239052.1 helix-turn-helix domain-containing protein [Chloracidobacterium sp.]HQX55835.1 helix-turn-helix domain-containing protein [Pyrinomonadaceae bacterium]